MNSGQRTRFLYDSARLSFLWREVKRRILKGRFHEAVTIAKKAMAISEGLGDELAERLREEAEASDEQS